MRFSGGAFLSTGGPGFNFEGGEKREEGERTLRLIPPTPDTHTHHRTALEQQDQRHYSCQLLPLT